MLVHVLVQLGPDRLRRFWMRHRGLLSGVAALAALLLALGLTIHALATKREASAGLTAADIAEGQRILAVMKSNLHDALTRPTLDSGSQP